VDNDTSAIILAGGRSTRLGRDKASEVLVGVSLLQRAVSHVAPLVREIIVVQAAGQRMPDIDATTEVVYWQDIYPEMGPLGGIYTGLLEAGNDWAITVACDMPLLQPALLRELLGLATADYDAVVPTNDLYLPEPLCAVYKRTCLEAIEAQINANQLKVALFFDKVRVRYVPPAEWRAWDPDGRAFLNVNREEDLKRAEALLKNAP